MTFCFKWSVSHTLYFWWDSLTFSIFGWWSIGGGVIAFTSNRPTPDHLVGVCLASLFLECCACGWQCGLWQNTSDLNVFLENKLRITCLRFIGLIGVYNYILEAYPVWVFTESAPRPIQSISCDVRVSVCLCVCLSVCPLPMQFFFLGYNRLIPV